MRKASVFTFLMLLVLIVAFSSVTVFAQERSVYWENYDVDITIQPDGSFRVAETQQLEFVGGRNGILSSASGGESSTWMADNLTLSFKVVP